MKEFEMNGLTSQDAASTLKENSFSAVQPKGSFIMGEGEMGTPIEDNQTPGPSSGKGGFFDIQAEVRDLVNGLLEEGITQDEREAKQKLFEAGGGGQIPPEDITETGGYDGDELNQDARVSSDKERLISELFRVYEHKIGGDPVARLRYWQRGQRLLSVGGEDFLTRYDELERELSALERFTETPDRQKPSPEARERVARLFDGAESVDDVFRQVFDNIQEATPDVLEKALKNEGEGLVRMLSGGTGNEERYVARFQEIIKNSGNIREDFLTFLAEVRTDIVLFYAANESGEQAIRATTSDDGEGPSSEGGMASSEELPAHDEELASDGGGDGDGDGPPTITGGPDEGEGEDEESDDERNARIRDEIASQGSEDWFDGLIAQINRSSSRENIINYLIAPESRIFDKLERIGKEVFEGDITWMQAFEGLQQIEDINRLKEESSRLIVKLRERFAHQEAEMRERKPQSFEELLELIMSKETDEWRTGGIRELIRVDGSVRSENFYAWVRKKANFWSNFSPDDPVNLYNAISIPMEFSPITFNEMVTNPQYFRRRDKRKIRLDEQHQIITDRYTGQPELTDITHTDAHYDNIKNKIMNDIYYYNTSRDFGVAYVENKGDDKALPGTMAKLLAKNHFTKADGGFKTIFSLPSTTVPDIAQEGGDESSEENYLTGEAVSLAVSVYDNISDIETLREMLGNDDSILSRSYIDGTLNLDSIDKVSYRDASGRIIDIGDLKNIVPAQISREARAAGLISGSLIYDEDWYDDNGRLGEEDWAKYQFADYINPFNESRKDPRILAQLRERVRQTLAFKMMPCLEGGALHGELTERVRRTIAEREERKALEERLSQDEIALEISFEAKKLLLKFAYDDAVHAEEVAYSTVYWTGIGAKNDTTATGFDAGTKLFETASYRIRQGAENRGGGPVGSMKDIMVYKRLVAPFMMAVRTTSNLTPKELARQISSNIGKRKADKARTTKAIAEDIIFTNNTSREYGENHYARGGGIYESLAGDNALDLSKMVTYDPVKGPVINRTEVIAKLNDYWKVERYRSSTYDGVDYAKPNRFLDITGVKVMTDTATGKQYRRLVYQTQSMAEAMFGSQVFDRAYRRSDGTVDAEKVQLQRSAFWKEGVALRLATLLAAHVDRKDPVEAWNMSRIEAFMSVLKAIPADIEVDEKNFWNTKGRKRFINRGLEKQIRKLSKTELWRLYGKTFAGDIATGFLVGLWKSFSEFIEETVKG